METQPMSHWDQQGNFLFTCLIQWKVKIQNCRPQRQINPKTEADNPKSKGRAGKIRSGGLLEWNNAGNLNRGTQRQLTQRVQVDCYILRVADEGMRKEMGWGKEDVGNGGLIEKGRESDGYVKVQYEVLFHLVCQSRSADTFGSKGSPGLLDRWNRIAVVVLFFKHNVVGCFNKRLWFWTCIEKKGIIQTWESSNCISVDKRTELLWPHSKWTNEAHFGTVIFLFQQLQASYWCEERQKVVHHHHQPHPHHHQKSFNKTIC